MLNLQKIDLKKEIEKLKNNDPGKTRGVYVSALIEYLKQKVLRENGEKGFKKLEENLKAVNYNLDDIKKFDDAEWAPSNTGTIVMIAAGKLFNWQEKDFIAIGKDFYSFAPTLKILIKFFISPEKTFRRAAKDWKRYYTFGEVEIVECDLKQKKVIVRLKNDKRHPILCFFYMGIFAKIVEMAIRKRVDAEEIKCMFKNDSYHEYIFKW